MVTVGQRQAPCRARRASGPTVGQVQIEVEVPPISRTLFHLPREFGCNASSIHAWVQAAGCVDGSGATRSDAPLPMNERQELIDLRRKFKQVQQERDILAKATAWFAGHSKLAGSEKTSMSSTNS